MKKPTPICPACETAMALKPGLHDDPYYACETFSCSYTCGTYRGNTRPFGIPADRETRELRKRAKADFERFLERASRTAAQRGFGFKDDADLKKWGREWLVQQGIAESMFTAYFACFDRKTTERLIEKLIEIEQGIKAEAVQ